MKEHHFGPIWFIPGENRGKYPHCHSIYIDGPGILIDPASDRNRLKDLKTAPGVKAVWLSHWHEDHFLHLDLFDDVPLLIAEADAPHLSNIDAFLDGYGIETQDRDMWRNLAVDMFHFRPRQPDQFIIAGEFIKSESLQVDVLSAPGHTPGSIALHFPNQDVLFMGDYDLTPFGPWYGDVESSIHQTIESVKMLRECQATIVLTSHEQGIFESPPDEIWDHYVNVIHEREGKLLNLLSIPHTMEMIVNNWIVYRKPRDPLPFYAFAEKALMRKHLEDLMGRGLVAEEDGRYIRL